MNPHGDDKIAHFVCNVIMAHIIFFWKKSYTLCTLKTTWEKLGQYGIENGCERERENEWKIGRGIKIVVANKRISKKNQKMGRTHTKNWYFDVDKVT